jgi:MYXO-CTERM domain-containing protein
MCHVVAMSVCFALLLVSQGWAFAPAPSGPGGIEPQRVRSEHAEEQLRWLRSPAFTRFAATTGAGWTARFDEATGTPRVLWGAGIPVPSGGQDVLVGFLTDVLQRHADLIGFEPGELRLRTASHVARTDAWYVDFDVLREDLPTWRGGIGARVVQGNLVLLHVATSPSAPLEGAYEIDAAAALDAAIAGGPAPFAVHRDVTTRQVLLERETSHGLVLRRVYEVHTRTDDPVGIWVAFVDGATGAVLHVYDEVRYATGTVSGLHHLRSPDGSALVQGPLPYAPVDGTSDSAFADVHGVYTVTDGPTYETELEGSYVTVINADGADGDLASPDPDLVWTTEAATQAEIDTYVFLHHVKAWGEVIAPEVEMSFEPLDSEVNVNAACNAYYDGAVHFFQQGYGCNNTGQIADVNYHEWGHGFHAYSIEAGIFDSSLSEGAADVVAFLQTKDSLIAPDFGLDGSAIRNVGPDQEYPEDYFPFYGYEHYNGLIFGGAMWDLLDLLEDAEGVDEGATTTGHLLAGILKGGTDIPGTFYEALVADDDDGDLDNGTPHLCELYDAFGRHGLGLTADGAAVITQHEPIVAAPADLEIAVEASIAPVAVGCVDGSFAFGSVWWRAGDGEWQEAPLAVAGDSIEAAIPAQPVGTHVAYYLEGETADGDRFASPWSGVITPYTFVAGDAFEIGCDDFEADDGGYVHSLVEGEDEEGADDWQWGSPNGSSEDPEAAWSGTNVWGNDLGQDQFNGQYQPDKVNRLRSPRLDTMHYTDVYLQYRRWLSVEDAAFDQAVVTVGGETVWTNWAGEAGDDHHVDRTWMHHTVDLGGLADQLDSVRIGWEIHSDGGLQLGGWTIDDVCLMAPATPDNRLAITDFLAVPTGGATVALSWTNPVHLPVTRIVIVRRDDRLPEAWDDGTIVAELASPAAGEPATATDSTAWQRGDTYYAAYASDGTAWLSWTVEGWNAATVDVAGGVNPGDADGDGIPNSQDPDYGRGCGCATPGAPGLVWLAAFALLARRRRS